MDAIQKLQVGLGTRCIVFRLLIRFSSLSLHWMTSNGLLWAPRNSKSNKKYVHIRRSLLCIHGSFDKSITVLPRKNRLRIYVDNQDKYYRLRELKRGLAEVVVKVSSLSTLDPPG